MALFKHLKIILSTSWRRAQPILFPSTIYTRELPSAQVALDLYKGEWSSQVPGKKLVSGNSHAFYDMRCGWAADAFGGIKNMKVLELGPLEGGHSYQLENLGGEITAIEGNKLAFQRCLIVKNLLDLKTKFLLGDFVSYLKTTQDKFDMIFASGVLYHMQDPVDLIKNMCRTADRVYIWTQVYDSELMKKNQHCARTFKSGRTKKFELNGKTFECHERIYGSNFLTYFLPGFCGGMEIKTYWMKPEDLIAAFETLGFSVVAKTEVSDNGNGPQMAIAAQKK